MITFKSTKKFSFYKQHSFPMSPFFLCVCTEIASGFVIIQLAFKAYISFCLPFSMVFSPLFFGGGGAGWDFVSFQIALPRGYLNVLDWLLIWRFKSKVTCPGSRDGGSNWGWQCRDQPLARAQVLPVCSPLLIDSRVQMWLLSTKSLLLNTVSVLGRFGLPRTT